MTVSTTTLKRIALYGAVITSATGLLLSNISGRRLKSSPLYQEALELLRNNPTAEKLLGTPIHEGGVKLREEDAKGLEEDVGWMTVHVKGPKDKGRLRYWFTIEEPHTVTKVELTVDKIPGKKLVIKSDTDLANST